MKKGFGGQSVTEYSIAFAIIVMVCAGMQIYVKRGLQARYREMVKDTTASVPGALNQYEPYYVNTTVTYNFRTELDEKMKPGGSLKREYGAGGFSEAVTISQEH